MRAGKILVVLLFSKPQHPAFMLDRIKQQLWPAISGITGTVLILLSCLNTNAQVFYSTNPKYLKVKTEQNNLVSSYRYTYPDTNITRLNDFFPRNFSGNLGLPSPEYFFKYGTDDLGFRFFNPPTVNDRVQEKQVEYYRSKGPYANLTGIAGAKLYQAFKMDFTHTYKDKVNFTLKFNRYSSQGFYQKQQSYANNFYLSSNHTAKNKRLGYYAYVLSNGNKNQENGGIRDGVLDDSTVALSKVLLPVRLSGATRDNRETKIMLNPWLRLNKGGDSLHGLDHFLQLKSRAAFNMYKYRDANVYSDNYYKLFYLDTAFTNDSVNLRQFTNELNYALQSRDGAFAFSAGYKQEINSLWQKNADLFYNHILGSDVVYRRPLPSADSLKAPNLESGFNLQYVMAGANAGNFKIENNSFFVFDAQKSRSLFMNLLYEKRNADHLYNYWIGNHFSWQNNGFSPQDQFQFRLGLRSGRNFSASVFYRNVRNYLFFGYLALPRQYEGSLSTLGASLDYSRVFFKHLGIGLNYVFQHPSSADYLRMPQNSGTAKLFFNSTIKKHLWLQLGAQVQVYESFTPYAYMPNTQAFYLQDRFQTETFPYLDVFLNARIHPVSFFVKVENVLSHGLAGVNYAFVPGYYQPERALRFGLSWMFFD
jgi:hypothetical protein